MQGTPKTSLGHTILRAKLGTAQLVPDPSTTVFNHLFWGHMGTGGETGRRPVSEYCPYDVAALPLHNSEQPSAAGTVTPKLQRKPAS